MATTLRRRDGRTYAAVLDDDGTPLVTTCASCGGFDYVAEIGANGFEYCPDCATADDEPAGPACRYCGASITAGEPTMGYRDAKGKRHCPPAYGAAPWPVFRWHTPTAELDNPGQWVTADYGTVTVTEHSAVCVCGNTPESAGFYPWTGGTQVEPTIDGPWDGASYQCDDCGRVFDMTTGRVSGIYPIVNAT